MKSKLEIYALAVSFAAVMCIVIAGGVGGYAIFEVIFPDISIPHYAYSNLSSNDAYWRSHCVFRNKCNDVTPSEDELTRQRVEALAIAVSEERRDGVQTLIKSIIFIFSGSISLAIHWGIARRAREGKTS